MSKNDACLRTMVDEQIIVKSGRVSRVPKWNIKHYAALTWVESTRT